MQAKRVAITLSSGFEVRLFGAEARRQGRRIFVNNHTARLVAEWVSGIPFATLQLKSVVDGEVWTEIILGPIDRGGMRFMEYLANN